MPHQAVGSLLRIIYQRGVKEKSSEPKPLAPRLPKFQNGQGEKSWECAGARRAPRPHRVGPEAPPPARLMPKTVPGRLVRGWEARGGAAEGGGAPDGPAPRDARPGL